MATARKPRSPPPRRPRRVSPQRELPVRKTEPKIQLNTRVSEANYQQLKLAAVLQRVPVQTLVEHAIEEFLSNHPELMRTAATASRSHPNATTRKPR
jgi:hypothetical protein